MKKAVLELILDGLNQLEEGSPTVTQEFQLTKSDVKYLQSHLYNYHVNVQDYGKICNLKISKESK